MNKYIEVISQIKPKNNLTFPIADTRDLIGGCIQVDTILDRDSIDGSKIRVGMLCYVKDTDTVYIYKEQEGWSILGAGAIVLTQEEYDALENKQQNTIYAINTFGNITKLYINGMHTIFKNNPIGVDGGGSTQDGDVILDGGDANAEPIEIGGGGSPDPTVWLTKDEASRTYSTIEYTDTKSIKYYEIHNIQQIDNVPNGCFLNILAENNQYDQGLYLKTPTDLIKYNDRHICYLQLPGLESDGMVQLTEQKYQEIVDATVIVVNDKYVVSHKQFIDDPSSSVICVLYVYRGDNTALAIRIDFEYLVSLTSYKLLQTGDIVRNTGPSQTRVMSQQAVTKALESKQDKLKLGRGLEFAEDGMLFCTLDTSLYQVVEELPSEGLPNKIYLVNNHSSEHRNTYSEYIWALGEWELLGSYQSTIDLEDYVTQSDLESRIEELYYWVDIKHFLDILNIEGGPITLEDSLYNSTQFYIPETEKNMNALGELLSNSALVLRISCGNILLISHYVSVNDQGIAFIGIDNYTGKWMSLWFEDAEGFPEGAFRRITIRDYDYLTSKDLIQINNQLEALDSRIDDIKPQPQEKTYYQITTPNALIGTSEGNLLYVPHYIEGDIFYGSYIWEDPNNGIKCFTEDSQQVSKIYKDPELKVEAYSSSNYVKYKEGDYLIIDSVNGDVVTNIARCYFGGKYTPYVALQPGFYIKTAEELKKIASIEDIPTNNSQLSNDSNYIHTINNKQSDSGEIAVTGKDIPVYGTVYLPEESGWDVDSIEFESNVNDAIIDLMNESLENEANVALLTKNKADKDELHEPETYVLNFNVQDGVNEGSYSKDEYDKLRAAIQAGKLIIIGGTVTRVTADSQAMAADYVVIRYSTPRISDDNKSVTISFYELKFGILTSGSSDYKYASKAIHKTIS